MIVERKERREWGTQATKKEAAIRASICAAGDERLKFFAADLTSDAGWDAALKGVDHVWHVASPLGANSPRDANALIMPARDGALRVLRAATKAGVKRIVLTSSTAASSPPPPSPDSVNDETVWTDPKVKGVNAYRQSKVIDKAKRVLGWTARPAATTMIDCAKSLIEKGAA